MNLFTLSSIEGQYLGPLDSMLPSKRGESFKFSEIISCVLLFVCVIKHGICFDLILSVRKEKGSGTLSPS